MYRFRCLHTACTSCLVQGIQIKKRLECHTNLEHARSERADLKLEESLECGMQATYLWGFLVVAVVVVVSSMMMMMIILSCCCCWIGKRARAATQQFILFIDIKFKHVSVYIFFGSLILFILDFDALSFALLSLSLSLSLFLCANCGSSGESVDNNKVSIVKIG